MSRRIIYTGIVLFVLILSQTAGRCLADAQSQFYAAERYYDLKEYGKAEQAYQAVLQNWPGYEHAIWAQVGVALSNIRNGGAREVSDASVTKLMTDFSGNPELAKAVLTVADAYRTTMGCSGRANQLYQYVLDNFSKAERMTFSQAIAVVMANIALGNEVAAEGAIEKLLSEFSGDERLAEGIYEIARYCSELGKNEKATQLYQYAAENCSGDYEHAIWSQESVVLSSISAGDDAKAQEGLDALTTNFAGDERLAESLYSIADKFTEAKKYQQAAGIYLKVIRQYPDSPQAAKAKLDIVKGRIQSFIDAGEDDIAFAMTGQLIADSAGDSYLPLVVSRGVAEQYYLKAFKLERQGLTNQAKECFRKAATIWEIVINEFADSDAAAEACCWAADCYRRLGEYELSIQYYQKVVDNYPSNRLAWHAIYMTGRNYQQLKEAGLVSAKQADSQTRAAYERLVEQYPECKPAKVAKRWLSRNR